jgi:hypothetical protein
MEIRQPFPKPGISFVSVPADAQAPIVLDKTEEPGGIFILKNMLLFWLLRKGEHGY